MMYLGMLGHNALSVIFHHSILNDKLCVYVITKKLKD